MRSPLTTIESPSTCTSPRKRPCTVSKRVKCTLVLASPKSLIATILISPVCFPSYSARRMLRPMRPYPLIATLIAMCFLVPRVLRQNLFDRCDDVVRREAVRLEQILRGRRGAEVIDADDLTLQAHVVPPLSADTRFDRHSPRDRGGKHALLVRVVLRVEGVGARH